MKQSFKAFLFSLLTFSLLAFSARAQNSSEVDSTGLPGDHFSLEGALELFKQSKSPEDFEKQLNKENNDVNNLDLNEDGEVDYVRVVDHMEGDVHAIVLQVPVSKEESQDVAVIEIEKTGPKEAMLQIVGDADVYGEQVIVEPYEEEVKQKGKGGPSGEIELTGVGVVVNVWGWGCVGYVYRPSYTVWVSPFYFGYYPRWWRPWRPRPWRSWHVGVRVYRPHYRVVSTHRVVRAHRVYTPRRTTSVTVRTRTTRTVTHRKATNKVTGTKTKTVKQGAVQGKQVDAVGAKKTTTTKVKGENGKVAGKKTTTKVGKTEDGKVVGKQTTKAKAKGANGKVAGKKTTTTKAKGKKGRAAGKKKTTTAKAKRGKKGAAGKKKTTVKKRRRR